MNLKQFGRRKFLKQGAALAGLAVGGIGTVSGQRPESEMPEGTKQFPAYGERSSFEKSERYLRRNRPWPNYPDARMNPLQDQIGIITPSSLHYVWSHGYDTPTIDPREHRLLIHGLVERPLEFTVEELKRLPSVCRIHFVECGGNTLIRR